MRNKIDCFLPYSDEATLCRMVAQLAESKTINDIYILSPDAEIKAADGCKTICTGSPLSAEAMKALAAHISADYALLVLRPSSIALGPNATERLLQAATASRASMVYSDYRTERPEGVEPHPTIDYQTGSIRDDFDFGPLVLIDGKAMKAQAASLNDDYKYAGWYSLRLALSRYGKVVHLREPLYTEMATDLRASGQRQFDYVNPRNRDVQVEMERAATDHLDAISALVDTANYQQPDFTEQPFAVEASVVIPVYNREKTIADAVGSALAQTPRFKFNVIVVDNHSTDHTTEILSKLAKENSQLIHIIPDRTDLGIGGCWNVALGDVRCGRFAVQLDSDDLYSSPDTLQTIVEAFYKQKAAMIVGSYRICDFDLNTLPPGLIDHREWTDSNGANNALRINGLGAPRAFFTPLARQIGFPNTSYGEDYAMGLAFSRHFRIGRIYSELYLCRRWSGNSDAALSQERQNANNSYKDSLRTMEIGLRQQMNRGVKDPTVGNSLERFFDRQLAIWPEVQARYRELHHVMTRELSLGDNNIRVQFNPARMVSTGASISKEAISRRPCFLCDTNRPKQQIARRLDDGFQLLVNPFPIMPMHFTIPALRHQPQSLLHHYGLVDQLLSRYPQLTVFYNGPKCGASAPDHLHLQAVAGAQLPLQEQWQRLSRNLHTIKTTSDGSTVCIVGSYPCPALLMRSRNRQDAEWLFRCIYKSLPEQTDGTEPMMNIVAWRQGDETLSVVFPRKKHRPDCYYAEGDDQLLVSPGALDMAGLIITPRQSDFERITQADVQTILNEVSLSSDEFNEVVSRIASYRHKQSADAPLLEEEPVVTVGIVSASRISFSLNAPYMAKGETITGPQRVEFSEGGILWNGNLYRELRFSPLGRDASFSLSDVVIGKEFHWERKETQTFQGTLRLVVEADKICAINELPVEPYLASVISSEMSATSSPELLKAHAVISRSWLLAQMQKRQQVSQSGNSFFSFVKKDDELIKWYDREDHTIFDVCADDHCQRYQGITKATSPHVAQAVEATRGQILMSGGEICDARFSKCCGGATEEFQFCWEDKPKSYLKATRDLADAPLPDLTVEANAERWIRESPKAFCNTRDKHILAQVLNDYDRETQDFYRWHVSYSQQELSQLIQQKLKIDFGQIIDLVPLERGRSGRISRLRIVGSKTSFTIGKELEIRRALSSTHLYSSAFVVDKTDVKDGVPAGFTLTGAGWGHGVGLCQIGAAVMGAEGYSYEQILLHYYNGAEIKKIYK